MGEWKKIESLIHEYIPISDIARIIWEYSRELHMSNENHEICVMMRKIDYSRIDSYDLYDKTDDGLMVGVRWSGGDIEAWISYSYYNDQESGGGGLWGGRLRTIYPRLGIDGFPLEPGIVLIDDPDVSLASDMAISRNTTVFSAEFRHVIFAMCNKEKLLEYKDALNRIFDMLHADWMAELTRHW